MSLVFVYGTLKHGGSNHQWLAGQRCLGEAQTIAGFTLYEIDDFPGMVADPSDRDGVTGELWEVDVDCLARLDELEGVAEKLYKRIPVALQKPQISEPVETYLFLQSLAGRARMGACWPV